MKIFRFNIAALILAAMFLCGSIVAAQTNGNGETGECTTKESCQALLGKYEALLKQYDSDITKTAAEKKTLQNQIAALKKKADSLAVQIKQRILDGTDKVEGLSGKVLTGGRLNAAKALGTPSKG